jgi:UDP-glucose 4-epimerase
VNSKILIIGGLGFIGSYLSDLLFSSGYDLTIIDRVDVNSVNVDCSNISFKYYDLNLISDDNYHSILSDFDYIIYMAWVGLPNTMNKCAENSYIENIGPLLRFLTNLPKSRLKKLIFFSSGGTVYGNTDKEIINESHPTLPISMYGITKLIAEQYVRYYCSLLNVNYSILRISNPYGRRQQLNRGQGLVGEVISRIKTGNQIDIYGNGLSVRDYIYIDDLIEAITSICFLDKSVPIFNIGTGRGSSVLDIISIVEEITGVNANIVFLDRRNEDVIRNVLDISKLTLLTAWSPKTTLYNGIKNLLEER